MIVGSDSKRVLTDTEKIVASFAGGGISGLVRTDRACDDTAAIEGGFYCSTPFRVINNHGILSLMRGLMPSCVREGFGRAHTWD